MNPDFERGREYERRETLALIGFLLSAEYDDTTMKELLTGWHDEIITSLPVNLVHVIEVI